MTTKELKLLQKIVKDEESRSRKPITDRVLLEDILARIKRLEDKENFVPNYPYVHPYVHWNTATTFPYAVTTSDAC